MEQSMKQDGAAERFAGHTPGPWWATDSGVRDSGGYICHTNRPTHYPDQDERYAQECEEREANKALIAAAPYLLSEVAALRKALEGVIASWDARNHERERFTPAHDDPDVGHIPDYWTPAASMVDSEAIAAARAALEGKQP